MAHVQAKRRTIVRVPGILSSEPIIEGTRIPVRAVVLYSYGYGNVEGVLEALPSLRRRRGNGDAVLSRTPRRDQQAHRREQRGQRYPLR